MLHAVRLREGLYLTGQGLGWFADVWRVNMPHLAECHPHCLWGIRTVMGYQSHTQDSSLGFTPRRPRRPEDPFFSNVDHEVPATNQELRLQDSFGIFHNRSDNTLAEGILLFWLNGKVFGSLRYLNFLPLKLSDMKVFHALGRYI